MASYIVDELSVITNKTRDDHTNVWMHDVLECTNKSVGAIIGQSHELRLVNWHPPDVLERRVQLGSTLLIMLAAHHFPARE